MSHTDDALDPNRPWIDDPRDTPGRMNWIATLFSPFGETSRVHFTRALTVLFFLSLVTGFMMFGAMGNGESYPSAIIGMGVVTALSFVAHIRRLASARRPVVLAGIVLLPIVLSLAAFVAVSASSVGAANEELAQYEADLADPVAASARRQAERDEARAATAAADDGEDANAGRDRRGGRPDGPPPGYKEGKFSPTAFVMTKAGPPAVMAWMVSGLIVFLWTLLWVARLPNGGGTIKERLALEAEKPHYETD